MDAGGQADIRHRAERDAAAALEEDRADSDLLAGLVAADRTLEAGVAANEDCVVAGCEWFDACLRLAASGLGLPPPSIGWLIDAGAEAAAGSTIVRLDAAAGALLAAERSALNFLGLLAAVATRARRLSRLAAPVPVYDTRKTVPLLRAAQKHAAAIGGMKSNRADLAAAAIIKENHIAAAGSIAAAYEQALKGCPAARIQVEVESIEQLEEALAAGVKRIMLDNFSPSQARQAVELAAGGAELEASGGIDESNVRLYAESGVDRISTGAATKAAGCIDLSLRIA